MLRPKRTKRVPAKTPFYPGEPKNAAPVGAKIRAMASEPRPFGAPRPIPQEILDKEAERKFTGGFNTKKSNICKHCFTAKPKNGKCCGQIDEIKVRKMTPKIGHTIIVPSPGSPVIVRKK